MLDERSKQILHAVVQSYIGKFDPVGSRFVTKKYSFGFSPATIRNVMADLEEMGFLSQPHTSAGRIPTDMGYRFYVDSLRDTDCICETTELLPGFADDFTKRLEVLRNDINTMFSEVSSTLSIISNYVGIAMAPRTENTTFERIDLLKYKSGYAVAVLITEEGIIKNKVLQIDPAMIQDDLNRISDYLNSEYSGLTIEELKGTLMSRMRVEKALWDKLMEKAVAICQQVLSFSREEIFVSGLYDVMNLPDFSDIARIKELSRAIKDKQYLLRFLEELAHAEGVQVVIGDENPVGELRGLSIVTSNYKEGDRPMGIIALIGPKRMDYSKAILMVDTVAQCISRTFRS
jgi:heat-inducible transcriptional repressor